MKRVLIANRGEIALRIIRACHEEGLEAVAVFSAADRSSPHVRAADRAVAIGPAAPAESYLRIDRLVQAALDTGAEAIHPGYGFLAERAAFAEAVADAGLIFVGPPAGAIRAMGDKTEARRRMHEAGVPIVPGATAPVLDLGPALGLAREIGYPVLVKAAAGGGGKGMRVVRAPEELEPALAAAAAEARKAFGDESVYIEKLIQRPRHVEIQVLADRERTIHLGERECSIQRRHQKLVEEAPSPAVTSELREWMGTAAVAAAEAVGYLGAGTCEFLLTNDRSFYFLEMNTRIQVEHPVTELV
ncbi:MAG: ATP-grasp domain-containing protein, partial [Gemmatimonadales bacterium]|nr:ATP-grasp domain-containing protein [Gemmatimonadales bacterium]